MVNFTNRIQAALIALKPCYMYWPNRAERRKIEDNFEEKGIPNGCVGAIDGCHIVLFAQPGLEDHKDFFNRKDRHSYNIQAVCNFD
jgi:hypothetical protein